MINAKRYRRINEIFQAALELDPRERASYVSEACSGDESLRKEVENLLSSDEQEWELLGAPVFEMVAPLLASDRPELAVGESVGHYRIISLLGAGGMGQVYLAEDTRLARKVAVKLLPQAYTQNESRLRRFQQEARAASALNHPNILTIYDIWESEGRELIVTEYVEGESLRQLIQTSRLSATQSVDIAIQVGGALSAAHQAGIVHRDIKPENIMVRRDGYVKVLDFGLAKLTEQSDPSSAAQAPDDVNISSGLIMGTVKYMSPEQASGKHVDPRSDIFSFGVVVYEMFAGRPPFEGKTSDELISAILKHEPTQINVSDAIRGVISKALRKRREERYQTIEELLLDLKGLRQVQSPEVSGSLSPQVVSGSAFSNLAEATESTASSAEYLVRGIKRYKTTAALALAGVLILVVGMGLVLNRYLGRQSNVSKQVKVARVPNTGRSVLVAISPDGKYLAHAITAGGKQSLWLIDHAGNNGVQIVPPADAEYEGLTFSKDGSALYYVDFGTLYQVPVSGGTPQKVMASVRSGVSFSPDGGRFAFVRRINSEESTVMIANADGSSEQTLLTRKKPEFIASWAAWSPDGSRIAFADGSSAANSNMSILTFDLASGKEQPLTSRKWQSMDRLAWLPDGSGLIVPAVEIGALPTQIWFVPFPSGEPHKITSDLNNYGDLYLSSDGKSLATIQFAERSRIWIVPRGDASEGRPITAGEQEQYRALALTPDGRLVYVASTDTGRDIWLMNTDETGRVQLTKNAGNNLQPDASPDGRYIVFSSNRAGKGAFNLWRMNVDGSNPLQLTFGRGEVQPACSPDGRWVVYSQGGPDTSNESKTLWKVPIDGGHPIPLIDTPSGGAAISADGSQIATWYMQGKDSPWQIAVISSEGGPPIKVFEAKRSTPARVRWTPDGQAITYVTNRDGIANIWSQPISGGPPKPVTQFTSEQIAGFDWSAAGDLICVRHRTTRDIVLMSNFK